MSINNFDPAGFSILIDSADDVILFPIQIALSHAGVFTPMGRAGGPAGGGAVFGQQFGHGGGGRGLKRGRFLQI